MRTPLCSAIAVVVVAGSLSLTTAAQSIPGEVTRVISGDTFEVTTEESVLTVTLHGVDCPEIRQPYANEAKTIASALVLNKSVTVEVAEDDGQGNVTGTVAVTGGRPLHPFLLQQGLAWRVAIESPDDEANARAEAQAREAGRGLWADEAPVPPWDWRAGKRTAEAPSAEVPLPTDHSPVEIPDEEAVISEPAPPPEAEPQPVGQDWMDLDGDTFTGNLQTYQALSISGLIFIFLCTPWLIVWAIRGAKIKRQGPPTAEIKLKRASSLLLGLALFPLGFALVLAAAVYESINTRLPESLPDFLRDEVIASAAENRYLPFTLVTPDETDLLCHGDRVRSLGTVEVFYVEAEFEGRKVVVIDNVPKEPQVLPDSEAKSLPISFFVPAKDVIPNYAGRLHNVFTVSYTFKYAYQASAGAGNFMQNQGSGSGSQTFCLVTYDERRAISVYGSGQSPEGMQYFIILLAITTVLMILISFALRVLALGTR